MVTIETVLLRHIRRQETARTSGPFISQRQFQALVNLHGVPRGELSGVSSQIPKGRVESRIGENASEHEDLVSTRAELMQGFSGKPIGAQLMTLETVCNLIKGFKKAFDQKLTVITKDIIPDASCKAFFKRRLRPILSCYHFHCKKNVDLFISKNIPSSLVKRDDDGTVRIVLRNWSSSCGCTSRGH